MVQRSSPTEPGQSMWQPQEQWGSREAPLSRNVGWWCKQGPGKSLLHTWHHGTWGWKRSPHTGTTRINREEAEREENTSHVMTHLPFPTSTQMTQTCTNICPKERLEAASPALPTHTQQFVSSYAPNQMLLTKTPGAALISAYAILLSRGNVFPNPQPLAVG